MILIPVHGAELGHDYFVSKARFIFFNSFQFLFFFNTPLSSDCETFHTMINKSEYVDAEMFIFETGFPYHQILFRTAVSFEFCRFEFFADELFENSLMFRNNFFFSNVFVCVSDDIIFEIRCRVTEIADAD